MPLEQLHFDADNPRFGGQPLRSRAEADILDEIVQKYGVDGVIDSIAANGYLETEPLVGIESQQGVKVIEGNRRLAALLVLGNDPRAKNQKRLRKRFAEHPRNPITTVPVIVYKKNTRPETLLPYLGVKHIVGPKEWDSYAKAAWMAEVLEQSEGKLTLQQIESMIGDEAGIVRKMVEAYYLILQLKEEGRFKPSDSRRKGRGSNPEFPFSWVYNALAYSAIRDWIGLAEVSPRRDPIPADRLDSAERLLVYLFGNDSRDRDGAISDSREIGELAKCIADAEKVSRLDSGMHVESVQRITRPPAEKLQQALIDAETALIEAWEAVGAMTWTEDQARHAERQASKVRKRAVDIHKRITEYFAPPDE